MIRCGAGAFSCFDLIVCTVLLLFVDNCDAVVARSFASRCSLSFLEKFISKVPHLPPTWIKSDMETSVLSMMPSSMDSVGYLQSFPAQISNSITRDFINTLQNISRWFLLWNCNPDLNDGPILVVHDISGYFPMAKNLDIEKYILFGVFKSELPFLL